MSALQWFEQGLERLVTGAFARAFRSAVQPMEIASALQREVDNSAQILSRDRRLAPNNFTIDLSPTDFDRLAEYGDTLSSELAGMLHEYVEEQRYLLAGPITLHFQRSDDLTTGRFRVRSHATANVVTGARPSQPEPAFPQVSQPPRSTPAAASNPQRTALFLDINGISYPLEAHDLVVGRGSGADIRIEDPGVSRRHVAFRVQPGPQAPTVSAVDLGSTNGTTIDGRRVQQATLSDGSEIKIGSTKITFHLVTDVPRQQSRHPYATQPPANSVADPRPPSPHGENASRPWSG
ncbi:MAG: FhaA domain-containing protein [Nocardioidaceae bacterium]